MYFPVKELYKEFPGNTGDILFHSTIVDAPKGKLTGPAVKDTSFLMSVIGANELVSKVIVATAFGTGPGFFNVGQIPSTTNIPSITPASGSIWGVDSSNRTIITSSFSQINQAYGLLKQKLTPLSQLDETQQLFTVKSGDEIKFENQESKVFTVVNVIPPNEAINGELSVELDKEVSSAIDTQIFLIRRFASDGSSIIFNQRKPPGPSGPAFIKPRFVTEDLNKDVDQFIQELKSKNLLT